MTKQDVLCDKVVCERWCVCVCVKDGVVKDGVWKMVCVEDGVVKHGVRQSGV